MHIQNIKIKRKYDIFDFVPFLWNCWPGLHRMVQKKRQRPNHLKQVRERFVGGKALLVREIREKWPEKCELPGRIQYVLFIIVVSRKASQPAQNIHPWGGWATTSEEHIRFHSCQPRTEIEGYHRHRLTKGEGLVLTCPVFVSMCSW